MVEAAETGGGLMESQAALKNQGLVTFIICSHSQTLQSDSIIQLPHLTKNNNNQVNTRAGTTQNISFEYRKIMKQATKFDHFLRNADSARSMARARAAALFSHSLCSSAGSLSATIPAPAWR